MRKKVGDGTTHSRTKGWEKADVRTKKGATLNERTGWGNLHQEVEKLKGTLRVVKKGAGVCKVKQKEHR